MSRHKHAMPARILVLVRGCADCHQIPLAQLLGPLTSRRIVAARYDAIRAVRAAAPGASLPQIGGWFGRDHTTIIRALRKADVAMSEAG